MKKNRSLIVTILSIALIFALTGFLYLRFMGMGNLVDPEPVRIILEKGEDISFEMQVTQSCGYEVGVSFSSQKHSVNDIKQAFGDKLTQLNLPAHISIQITDDRNEVIFENLDFGGENLVFRYGPDPLKFIAGQHYLNAGKYRINLKTQALESDLSNLDNYFFIAQVPKTRCGREGNG